MIKPRNLFSKLEVLHKGRAPDPGFETVVRVINPDTEIGRERFVVIVAGVLRQLFLFWVGFGPCCRGQDQLEG